MYVPGAEEPDLPEGPSKSQLKRDDEVLQALGRRLVTLSKAQIAEFPVGDTMRAALMEWKRLGSRDAQRRHIKRIGKLIRDDDPEALELAMDRLSPDSAVSGALTQTAQRWCERLLAEGNEALTEFVDKHPGVEAQRLRQILRKAKKDPGTDKPSPAARELLRFVRKQVVTAL